MEAESLGGAVVGATQIVKKFLVHRCGHDQKPISAAECMKSMIKGNHYIIATQDRELQEYLRSKPGQPLMYLHKKTPVLEQPSDASRKLSEQRQNETHDVVERDVKRLQQLKRAAGLPVEEEAPAIAKKKFKKKQPNPLSCKKKKKKKVLGTSKNGPKSAVANGVQEKGVQKKRRNRIRVAQHVKDILLKEKS